MVNDGYMHICNLRVLSKNTSWMFCFLYHIFIPSVFALIFFTYIYLQIARKPNLEKISIYSNKFFHNFHLSESSFPCPGLSAKTVPYTCYIFCLSNMWTVDTREQKSNITTPSVTFKYVFFFYLTLDPP